MRYEHDTDNAQLHPHLRQRERMQATLTAPQWKFRFPKQLEQELTEQFNKQYPHRTHRVTGVHLMRN